MTRLRLTEQTNGQTDETIDEVIFLFSLDTNTPAMHSKGITRHSKAEKTSLRLLRKQFSRRSLFNFVNRKLQCSHLIILVIIVVIIVVTRRLLRSGIISQLRLFASFPL